MHAGQTERVKKTNLKSSSPNSVSPCSCARGERKYEIITIALVL